MANGRRATSARTVWALIAVETLCLLGAEISRFGMTIWILASHGEHSVSAFSYLMAANVVPGMLALPIAGSVVDRHPRKAVMIGAAIVTAIGTALVFAGALVGELSLPVVLVGASLASIGEAFQWPALAATVPLLASAEDLPRYNGVLESGRAIGHFAGPAIGGVSIAVLGVSGLVGIDLFAFVVSTIVVATLRLPSGPAGEEEAQAGDNDDEDDESASLIADAQVGLRWIFARRPVVKLLLVATFANFFLAVGEVVMQPYGLSLVGERELGIVNACFGAGMIVAGLLCGPLAKRFTNIHMLFASALVLGVSYVAYGFARGPVGLAALNIAIAMMITIVNSSLMTIWQLKVPERLQGRVFAAMGLIADITTPVSFLLAGPISERLLPAAYTRLGADAIWGASLAGQLGALCTLLGALLFAGFAFAWTVRDIRDIEKPDEL
jgi:DHA3 family macrolide efflux protein-like MFS transporter